MTKLTRIDVQIHADGHFSVELDSTTLPLKFSRADGLRLAEILVELAAHPDDCKIARLYLGDGENGYDGDVGYIDYR